MSLKENIESIKIPAYSHKQEIFNFVSHLIGLPLAILIAVLGIIYYVKGVIRPLDLVGLLVFAVSAFLVYLVSSVYHGMKNISHKKRILRVIDHCTIYLLIAGTYTPVCLAMFNQIIIGPIMLIIEWVGAILGIILNAFFFKSKASRIISFVLYIVMGWLCAFCCAWNYIKPLGFLYILIGGFIYTIGSILYGVGKANQSFHCVFHIFVLLGTITQTIGVFLLY